MMRASLIALAGVALLQVGCVKQEYSQQGRVNQDPLVIDQAMQLRNWDKSYAVYQNGGIHAGTTGFGYVTKGDVPQGLNYIADVGVFGLNVVTSPYTIYEERHGVNSSGINLPETYTAVPPVPPRYNESVYGVPNAPTPEAGTGTGADTAGRPPINTIGNPDAANGNVVNPTFPNSPQSPNNPNNPNANSAGNAAANDTSSGTGPGGAPTVGNSVLGSGAGGAAGSGKAGK